MEDLFREILAHSPSLPSTSLPLDESPNTSQMAPFASPEMMLPETFGVDWVSEEDMQRILDMLPGVHSDVDIGDEIVNFPSALDLGLENFSTVGVF